MTLLSAVIVEKLFDRIWQEDIQRELNAVSAKRRNNTGYLRLHCDARQTNRSIAIRRSAGYK